MTLAGLTDYAEKMTRLSFIETKSEESTKSEPVVQPVETIINVDGLVYKLDESNFDKVIFSLYRRLVAIQWL